MDLLSRKNIKSLKLDNWMKICFNEFESRHHLMPVYEHSDA